MQLPAIRTWFGRQYRLLQAIHMQGDKILSQLDDIKAADAAEATAVASALAEIATLAKAHQDDLAQLAAQASAGADLSPLVAAMQARAKTLTDAVASVQTQVAPTATPVPAADPSTPAGDTGTTG